MNWFQTNWQLKAVAFILALFLWLVLYLNPPSPAPQILQWPAAAPRPAGGR